MHAGLETFSGFSSLQTELRNGSLVASARSVRAKIAHCSILHRVAGQGVIAR
jgi:hypothetical protein